MRNFLFIIITISFGLTSCKEVLPEQVKQNVVVVVGGVAMDTVYKNATVSAPQSRVVLMEEFTGASCVNCPAGHLTIKDILATHDTKVAAVGLHFGSLAAPVKFGEQDLRTEEAKAIAAAFSISAMPLALIDRVTKSGTNRIYGKGEWTTAIDSRVTIAPKANVKTTVKYDNTKQVYILSLEIELLEDFTDPLNYSIALLENKISVTQKDGSIEIEDYEQEHVTRKFYTSALGSKLPNIPGATKYEKGTVIKKQFYIDGLKSEWKLDNMYIVAFVTRETSANKEVLQASQVALK